MEDVLEPHYSYAYGLFDKFYLFMFQVHGVESRGKRKLWLLFILAGWQPLIMWWLTYSLVPSYTTLNQEFETVGL